MRTLVIVLAIVFYVSSIAFAYQQIAQLKQMLQDERLDRDIFKAALRSAESKQPTIINNFQSPNVNIPPINLTITNIPGVAGEAPRVRVDAPSVPCKTVEECERIFGQADQAITVDQALKAGTVVPVCLVDLVNNSCPEGQRANRPLAADFGFKLDVIRLTSGVFVALEPEFGPLKITGVATITKPLDIQVPGAKLPYNLSLAAKAIGSSVFAGPVYQNYLGFANAVYEVGYGLFGTPNYFAVNVPLW